MKILIFSDTHGKMMRVEELVRCHRDADVVIFLGDGLNEAYEAARKYELPLWTVRGNCDAFPPLWESVPAEQCFSLEGHRLFITHGDRYGVKGGYGALISAAKKQGCDIALFGHTHEPCETYIADTMPPLYLFNPGSLGAPRRGEPSYGLLLLTEKNVLFSHGQLTIA